MPQTRISERTHRTLRQLAAESGRTFGQVIEDAIARYERDRLLEVINFGYATLRQDPESWAAERRERDAWDGTLSDGLDGPRAGE